MDIKTMKANAQLKEAGFTEMQVAFYHKTVGVSVEQMLELGLGNLEALYGVIKDEPSEAEQPSTATSATTALNATKALIPANTPRAASASLDALISDEAEEAIIQARKAFTAKVFPVRTLRGFSQYLQGMPSAALLQQIADNKSAGNTAEELLQDQLSKWLARDGLIKCKRLRSNQTTRAQEALVVNTLKTHTHRLPVLKGLCETFEHEAQELNDSEPAEPPVKAAALMRNALAINEEQLDALIGETYEANIVEWCLAVEALLAEVAEITSIDNNTQLITALLTAGTRTPEQRTAAASKDLDALMEAALADLGIDF